jgi:capsular polysaccharide biosynthesis protein
MQLEYHGNNRESLPRQLAAAEGHILGPEGRVWVYEDAEVVGRRPIVGVDGRYFPPSWLGVDTAFFIHQEKYLRRNLPLSWPLQRLRESRPERAIDVGYVLLGERSHEFPAWHHEVLPKLRWLEEYERVTGETPTLIVSADLQSFHERSLRLMGYGPDSWVKAGSGGLHVGRLLVPPHPLRAKGTHLHTSPHDWVANRILSNVSEATAEFADRIYISRRDADRRQIRNEDEVVAALAEEGFEWYEPGRLSYEEEVALFAGADHIVGAHGKGLASLFYGEGATLFELFPDRGATEHYFLTARECGFEYEFLTCETVPDERNVRARDRDFIVDIDALRERVSTLIAPTRSDSVPS